jgi:hypothetical protein
MNDKRRVSDLLARLPDHVTLRDIAKEIEFVAGVREGLGQLDREEGIPVEEVDKMISVWMTK